MAFLLTDYIVNLPQWERLFISPANDCGLDHLHLHGDFVEDQWLDLARVQEAEPEDKNYNGDHVLPPVPINDDK